MQEHGRWSSGANDHVFRLRPRRDDRRVGVWDDDVHARRQQHFEVTLRIGPKGGDYSISLPHCEAGTERRVARHSELANRLHWTTHDGPDKRRFAWRGRSAATCCPAKQRQGKQRRSSHGYPQPLLAFIQLAIEVTAVAAWPSASPA